MPKTIMHVTTVPVTLFFLRGQISYMKKRGMEVVAISSPGLELETFGKEESIAVYAVKMSRQISPLADVMALAKIWYLCMRIRPDILHAHTPKAGLLGMIAAWSAGITVRVVHLHGLPSVTASGFRHKVLFFADWLTCALAHRIYPVSPSLAQVVTSQNLCDLGKIKILGSGSVNGVDAEHQFNPSLTASSNRLSIKEECSIPETAVVIGFVGRLGLDKGIMELISAWQQLRSEHEHVHLMVVGAVEDHVPLPQGTMSHLLNDGRVHLLGWRTDMPMVYASMDVLVLPSHREGLGQVLLEAAAMSLPVVATDIPGCRDAVSHGVTGILVPPRNVPRLVEAIGTYVENERLRNLHGQAGRKRVQALFDPEIVRRAIFNEYQNLLER